MADIEYVTHRVCPACEWKYSPLNLFSMPSMFRADKIIILHYVQCPACGLTYAQEYPNQEYMYEAYNEKYRRDMEARPGNNLRHEIWRSRNIVRLLKCVKYLDRVYNFLDVGCGKGATMHKMHRLYKCPVYGVEPNGDDAALAGQYGPVTDRIENVEDAPSFHFVVASHSLEHMVDPEDILRKIRRRMMDNGLLYLEVPGFGSSIMEPWHAFHFSPQSLRVLANRCGFLELMYWEHMGSGAVLPGTSPLYLSMVLTPFLDLDGKPMRKFYSRENRKELLPYGYS